MPVGAEAFFPWESLLLLEMFEVSVLVSLLISILMVFSLMCKLCATLPDW